MQPYDKLTDADKEAIINYTAAYGKSNIMDLENTLYYWNKNKRTLFKAFGNQLRVSYNINEKMNRQIFIQKLQEIYTPIPQISSVYDLEYGVNLVSGSISPFIKNLMIFLETLYKNHQITINDAANIRKLLKYDYIEEKTVNTTFTFSYMMKKPLKITSGSKTVKSIQKVLNYYEFPCMSDFEEWRNKISNLQTSQYITQTMVLSIHPLDYMTMSDNDCNWSSCMSWMTEGCYSLGTIEMMNSNMAVVAYLKSSNTFTTPATGNYQLENKSWRNLLFVHKKIIVAGKSYPFNNKSLSIKALTYMRHLVEKNLHWTYQYINQRYGDMDHWDSNIAIQEGTRWIKYYNHNYKGDEKHAIWLYTRAMYNDMSNSHINYWCCRNYVDKTLRLSISGPATCMCCGGIIEDNGDQPFDDGVSQKFCECCYDAFGCSRCNTVDSEADRYRIKIYNRQDRDVCKECLIKEYAYSKKFDYFTSVDNLDDKYCGNDFEVAVFLSYNNTSMINDIAEYVSKKIPYYSVNISARLYYDLKDNEYFKNREKDYLMLKMPYLYAKQLSEDKDSNIEKACIKQDNIGRTKTFYRFKIGTKTADAMNIINKYSFDFIKMSEVNNVDEIISPFLIK